ncbi:MAG: hypothetical protein J5496_01140 [Lachnospiraceae bacterium]|nr:hypothetical protein [Lachnospiraceae bacterium]
MPYLENPEQAGAVSQPDAARSDDVLLCGDGTYRWIYELPMRKSFFLLFEVWRVLLIAAILPFLLTVIISDGSFLERLQNAGITFGIVFGILFVLSLPAYWIVTRANNGKYTVLFEMDDRSVSHSQIKTEKAEALNILTMLVGAAAGNATATGIGMMQMGGGSLTCRFDKVRNLKGIRRKHLIKVHTLLKRNQVYVKDSDFDFVFGYLKDHCPNAKISLR